MRILFCQLRNHGDIIRIFPLIDAIKEYYTDWYIGFTCFSEMVDTCKISKNIDVIIEQPRFLPITDTQGGTRILDCSIMTESVAKARKEQFDIYVDLHGVFQSAVFGAMCNIKVRLGRSSETAKDGAVLFYTDICSVHNKEINRMERHFLVFNKLFPEVQPIIRKVVSKKKIINVKKIVIFPGSSKMGILKRWSTEKYVEVANRLANQCKVLFVIGPEEQEIYDIIVKKTICPIKMCSTWNEIEEALIDCILVIGNDTAYLHFAIWKSISAIMICGPLSPMINGVWKYGVGETIYSSERCECCDVWKGICDKYHKCMNQIHVEDVMMVVDKYLE